MNPSSSSKLSTILMVFMSSNLLLLLLKTPSKHKKPSSSSSSSSNDSALELISFIFSRLSAIAMANLSHIVYHGIHPSLENFRKNFHKSWKQTAVTLLYIELLNTASASLLLTLSSVGRSTTGAASEAAVLAGAVFLICWLGPLLFMHSDAACKISIIVAMSEEGCRGEKALERAGELVGERKVVGFSLMALTLVVDKAMDRMRRFGSVVSLVEMMAMFFIYLLYTSFYYECRKKGSLKGEKVL